MSIRVIKEKEEKYPQDSRCGSVEMCRNALAKLGFCEVADEESLQSELKEHGRSKISESEEDLPSRICKRQEEEKKGKRN